MNREQYIQAQLAPYQPDGTDDGTITLVDSYGYACTLSLHATTYRKIERILLQAARDHDKGVALARSI